MGGGGKPWHAEGDSIATSHQMAGPRTDYPGATPCLCGAGKGTRHNKENHKEECAPNARLQIKLRRQPGRGAFHLGPAQEQRALRASASFLHSMSPGGQDSGQAAT